MKQQTKLPYYLWLANPKRGKTHAYQQIVDNEYLSLCGTSAHLRDANSTLSDLNNCKLCLRIIKKRTPKKKNNPNELGYLAHTSSHYNHFFYGDDRRTIATTKCNLTVSKLSLFPYDESQEDCPICLIHNPKGGENNAPL